VHQSRLISVLSSLGGGSTSEATWRLAAIALFTAVLAITETGVGLYQRSAAAGAFTDAAVTVSQAQARMESELASILHLSSGLSAYFTLNADHLDAAEIEQMFALLHDEARHVRNFGLAVGYVLTYVYPVEANRAAIGLDYRRIPRQYEAVREAIERGQPTLSPLLDLAQGGQGVIYRAPIFRNGEYWGLLSTVIDVHSLTRALFSESGFGGMPIAVRDPKNVTIWGDDALFDNSDNPMLVSDHDWQYVAQPASDPRIPVIVGLIRGFGLLLAASLAFSLYMALRHHDDLIRLSRQDALTGLANRRRLNEHIRHGLERVRLNNDPGFTVVFVDLDGFKQINDSMGHRAGDAVLSEIARRLVGLCHGGDVAARWGGDEFAIYLAGLRDRDPEVALDRFRSVFDRPVTFNGTAILIRGSVGHAIAPRDGDNEQDLICAADRRMYRQKTHRHAPDDRRQGRPARAS